MKHQFYLFISVLLFVFLVSCSSDETDKGKDAIEQGIQVVLEQLVQPSPSNSHKTIIRGKVNGARESLLVELFQEAKLKTSTKTRQGGRFTLELETPLEETSCKIVAKNTNRNISSEIELTIPRFRNEDEVYFRENKEKFYILRGTFPEGTSFEASQNSTSGFEVKKVRAVIYLAEDKEAESASFYRIDGALNHLNNLAILFELPEEYIGKDIIICFKNIISSNWVPGLTEVINYGEDIRILRYAGSQSFKISAQLTENIIYLNDVFQNALGDKYPGIENWDLSKVTNTSNMFKFASYFNNEIGKWDMSNVKDCHRMFYGAQSFNQYIGDWELKKITHFGEFFLHAESFNQDLSKWDMSKVTSTFKMFYHCDSFNQDLSKWDVSNVKNMHAMFGFAKNFNQDLSGWNLSLGPNVTNLFEYAENFNQDISGWDMSKVRSTQLMFYGAKKFNQDISKWDVGNVEVMSEMFNNAISFNQDISNWDVGNVSNMHRMFIAAKSFNQDIGNWKVSNVTDMSEMFSSAENFNQNIGNWTVSNVTNMSEMFRSAENFNQDISSWDVSNVTNMINMFSNAKSFSCDLSKWKVENVIKYGGFNRGAPLLTDEKCPKWKE